MHGHIYMARYHYVEASQLHYFRVQKEKKVCLLEKQIFSHSAKIPLGGYPASSLKR